MSTFYEVEWSSWFAYTVLFPSELTNSKIQQTESDVSKHISAKYIYFLEEL
jgi:hypothetical protein